MTMHRPHWIDDDAIRTFMAHPIPSRFDPLTVKCETCGAEPGDRCRDPRDKLCDIHTPRWATVGVRTVVSARGSPDGVDLRLIENGAPSPHELLMCRDTARLDSWRVRVACACMARVQASRGFPVAQELLRRWAFPVRLALAPRDALFALVSPLGLPGMRVERMHRASIAAAHGESVIVGEDKYAREAVALCVARAPEVTSPTDKILRAVRARLLRERRVTT